MTIKLLVGLDVDKSLNRVFEVEKDGKELSNDELADRFFESLNIALNDENLDNQEFYEQVSYFLGLLQNGRLQIKKTLEPNHAKLYFFKVKDEVKAYCLMTVNSLLAQQSYARRCSRTKRIQCGIGDYGTKKQKNTSMSLEIAVRYEFPNERRSARFVKTNTGGTGHAVEPTHWSDLI
jgi:hypothetical protein